MHTAIGRVLKKAFKRPAKRAPKKLADVELSPDRSTSLILRNWRNSGSELLTRDRLAAVTGRCMGTIQNWERDRLEPRVCDIRAMEQCRPGLVKLLFPEAFPGRKSRKP